jgi:hypothetical protein
MPCCAQYFCAAALVVKFSAVQDSPDKKYSTGTGPACACGGINTLNVIGVKVVLDR